MNLLNNAAYSIPDYTTLNTTLTQCDLDPKGSGKLLGFYNEAKLNPVWDKGLTWNKEHVWPQSRGVAKTGPGADPHMLRATSTSINSSRGNDFYGLSSDGVTGGEVWDPGQYLPKYRGIAARIVFYTATRYWKKNGLELSNSPDDATSKKTMGKLSRLLEWNLTYPVDETETYRNEVLYKLYNVRNPFIDYPSLATSIWGS
jgi:endonuclease I